jgi:His/Glu/Gln/Arg/opine family amino acid ABC transporter permease subunit
MAVFQATVLNRAIQSAGPSWTDYRGDIIEGVRNTVTATLLGFGLGLVVGIVVAVFRLSPIRPLRTVGKAYTSLMVNSPLIFFILFLFYGMPKLDFRPSSFECAVLGLGLYLGGYVAEALRAGVNTVANGQAEAARAIGLTFGQTLHHVVLPQAIRSSIGPLGVLLNASFRNVAVVGAISFPEIVFMAKRISEDTADYYPLFVVQFAVIAILAILVSIGASLLDRRFAVKR